MFERYGLLPKKPPSFGFHHTIEKEHVPSVNNADFMKETTLTEDELNWRIQR